MKLQEILNKEDLFARHLKGELLDNPEYVLKKINNKIRSLRRIYKNNIGLSFIEMGDYIGDFLIENGCKQISALNIMNNLPGIYFTDEKRNFTLRSNLHSDTLVLFCMTEDGEILYSIEMSRHGKAILRKNN